MIFDWMTDLQQVYIAQIFIEEILFQPTSVLVNNEHYQGFHSTELPKEALYRTQKSTQNEVYAGVKQTVARKNNEMCKESCPDLKSGRCNERCGHIVMEMWPTHQSLIDALSDDTLFVTSKPSGLLGLTQMFVPKFLWTDTPHFAKSLRIRTETFLAKTFKRPVTWEEFCNHHVASFPNRGKCPPPDIGYKQRYFDDSDGILNASFHGLFVIDPENNCTANPRTCAGNIISPNKCNWMGSWELFQFNNMSEPDRMKRMGKNTLFRPEGSYSTDEMFQIWDAAQFNNEVLMYWWYPDISYSSICHLHMSYEK